MTAGFANLPFIERISLAKQVSVRQTQEDFIAESADNVYVNIHDEKGWRDVIDLFTSAGARAQGHGNQELKIAFLHAALHEAGKNLREVDLDDIMPEKQDHPDYAEARIFAAAVLQGILAGFVPDTDCYTPPGTELKLWLANKLYPWKHPMKVALHVEGARANEAVLKILYDKNPERDVVLALSMGREEGIFPGRSLGALSLHASKEVHRRGFPTAFRTLKIPYPRHSIAARDPEEYVKLLDDILLDAKRFGITPDNILMFNLELVLGEGGFYEADLEYAYALDSWRKKYGIFLNVDEIQTGMGWTGTLLALEQYPELDLDTVVLGKALTGGIVPLSAMIVRADLDYEEYSRDSSTFGGYQMASAAALENLKLMTARRQWERTKAFGNYMREALRDVFGRYPHLLDQYAPFSGLGMMQGVGFAKKEIRDFVKDFAFEHGVLVEGTGSNRLRIRPPQIMTKEQFDEAMKILSWAMKQADVKFQ